MSEVYFTADTHFYHGNIIKYCNRPFMNEQERAIFNSGNVEEIKKLKISKESIELMNKTILDNINEVVKEDDILYVNGDFGFFKEFSVAEKFRNQINCKNLYLIKGNHDSAIIYPLFKRVIDQCLITVNNQMIFMNHYAMTVWDQSHRDAWHIYGHTHNVLHSFPGTLSCDVGVDAWNFKPVSFNDLKNFMSKKDKNALGGYFRTDTKVELKINT